MDTVLVSRNDIDALAQALDAGALPAGDLPAGDLLRSLIAAIRQASGDVETVAVSVEVADSLQETFEAAFTPEPAPAPGGPGVHVTVMKITRA
jgi:hypothetical protein